MTKPTLPVIIAYLHPDTGEWELKSGTQRPKKGFAPMYVLQYEEAPLPTSPEVPGIPLDVVLAARELFDALVEAVPVVGADGGLFLHLQPSRGQR